MSKKIQMSIKNILWFGCLTVICMQLKAQSFKDMKSFSAPHNNTSITSVTYSPDGSQFATATAKGLIVVRKLKSRRGELFPILRKHIGAVTHISFHPNGKYLASTGKDGTVKIWDLASEEIIFDRKAIGKNKPYYNFAYFVNNGKSLIYGGTEGKLMLIEPFKKGTTPEVLFTYNHSLFTADCSKDGQRILVGTKHNTVLIDLQQKKTLKMIKVCNVELSDAKFTANENIIGTICENGFLATWDIQTGEQLVRKDIVQPQTPLQIDFSDNGQYLIVANGTNTPKVWKMADWALDTEIIGHIKNAHVAQFAPNSKYLITGGDDGQVQVWQWQKVYKNEIIPTPPPPPPPAPIVATKPILPSTPPVTTQTTTPSKPPVAISKAVPPPSPTVVPVVPKAASIPKSNNTKKPIDWSKTFEPAPTKPKTQEPSPPQKIAKKIVTNKVKKPKYRHKRPIIKPNLDQIRLTYTKRNLPDSLGQRKVKAGKRMIVTGEELKIMVWDSEEIDGDTISLFLNGEWLLKEYPLTRKKKKMNIKINRNADNYLILYAHNEGSRPPNTAALKVSDGRNEKRVALSSNMENCDAINFKFR